jgi:hypothetical protein
MRASFMFAGRWSLFAGRGLRVAGLRVAGLLGCEVLDYQRSLSHDWEAIAPIARPTRMTGDRDDDDLVASVHIDDAVGERLENKLSDFLTEGRSDLRILTDPPDRRA